MDADESEFESDELIEVDEDKLVEYVVKNYKGFINMIFDKEFVEIIQNRYLNKISNNEKETFVYV